MFPDLAEGGVWERDYQWIYRLSNQAIIHHLQNLTKNPTQSRFEIEEESRDGRSKKHGNKGGSDGS